MIDVVEIKGPDLKTLGIIDTASSVIWHTEYYGAGDFEIYIEASEANKKLLQRGNFVYRPDCDEIGVIEKVISGFTSENGYMITASGPMAKGILGRRVIYSLSGNTLTATVLKGRVEAAIRQVISDNAISCTDQRREISILALGADQGYPDVIVSSSDEASQKQVSHNNLLKYTDGVLEEFEMGSQVKFVLGAMKLKYSVYRGADRSVSSSTKDAVVFSAEYDSLDSCEYVEDESLISNSILVGGEGEGIERYYTLLTVGEEDLALRELFLDEQSQARSMLASDLLAAFPTGSFVGLDFIVTGNVVATLIIEDDREYSLSTLQSKFPTGSVSNHAYVVNSVIYATEVYGKTDTFVLTDLGYKAMLDADGSDGKYKLSDAIYTAMLAQKGMEQLGDENDMISFFGQINVTTSQWKFRQDFDLGDIVCVQDDGLGIIATARITEVTEVQDENGYTVEAVFGKHNS